MESIICFTIKLRWISLKSNKDAKVSPKQYSSISTISYREIPNTHSPAVELEVYTNKQGCIKMYTEIVSMLRPMNMGDGQMNDASCHWVMGIVYFAES
jgi:hypothetical protein